MHSATPIHTKLTTLAGAFAAASILTSVAFGPGVARADVSDCLDKHVCLFGDQNYFGRWMRVPQDALWQPNVGDFMNDLTTSIWNRTDVTVCFFEHDNYGGHNFCLGAGQFTPNVGGWWNDQITSFRPL